MKGRQGQIGDTMTWVVATVVIIVILIISVYVAGGSDVAKKAVGLDKEFKSGGGSDLLVAKSMAGYLLTDGKKVYNELKIEEEFNEYTGDLVVGIFKNFYEEDYEGVWFGVNFEGFGFRGGNDYFDTNYLLEGEGGRSSYRTTASEKIILTEDKFLEFKGVVRKQ